MHRSSTSMNLFSIKAEEKKKAVEDVKATTVEDSVLPSVIHHVFSNEAKIAKSVEAWEAIVIGAQCARE